MAVHQPSVHETQRDAGPAAANGVIPEHQTVFLPPPDAPAHAPAGSSWTPGPAHVGPTVVTAEPRSAAPLAQDDNTSAATGRVLSALVAPPPLILATEPSVPGEDATGSQQQQRQSAAAASPSWQRTVVSPFSAVAAQGARSPVWIVATSVCAKASRWRPCMHLPCIAATLRQVADVVSKRLITAWRLAGAIV